MQKRFRIIALMIGLLSLVATTTAQPVVPYEPQALLPVDSAVLKGTLDNGLTYYVRHNETPADKVELRLVIDAG
ncbi:MAG: hypothetical protein LBM20_02685, partial [Rikenellaceae bacterium]|nr:hypothetical protein [Rikenellaceae bacterium]